jgi:hypothetical protein
VSGYISEFLHANVEVVSGVGHPAVLVTTVNTGFPGPQGPPGSGGGGGGFYQHSQPTAASTWTITHNLGVQPTIQVRSLGGLVVDAEVLHLSASTAQVTFDAPFAGYAICS